ncbi:short chain dehydrogenase [Allofrancisella guangzhouensis]|uniref:Short-chain dehydrogenase n=1 Tax=Allofrancisella guangzhouensis TaxID=594679 RepID=A0A0A8E6G9_9GAMM|nr:short chain dehydrogenase [Allofrancisella guangzhouensis]AJC49182.1 short-chain dehydrogenase [Allofrancisella guangzhouensis]MBK2026759.1 short chain dehydrogenase [Allofrancisella guangzhouensis]MBK2044431.1 short chain dehydrogenase [Allofrancisella guangzhouensis]MBK2045361.1 short chain dehydrogenase [Allofrancisella guangzhouensis]
MAKKVVLVGATGVIGSATYKILVEAGFDVASVNFSGKGADYKVDIQDTSSIYALFEQIESFDALVSTTGKVAFKDIRHIEQKDWGLSLSNKLLGQINLVQIGAKYVSKGGSFTLTSGILNVQPIANGTIAATINSALEGFVKAASLEYTDFRINIVSPTVVEEALEKYAPFFVGFKAIKASCVAKAYLKSVAGIANGEVIKVGF